MKRVVLLRNGRVAVLRMAPIIWLEQGWAYIGALVAQGTGQLLEPLSGGVWTVSGNYLRDGGVHALDVVSGLRKTAETRKTY